MKRALVPDDSRQFSSDYKAATGDSSSKTLSRSETFSAFKDFVEYFRASWLLEKYFLWHFLSYLGWEVSGRFHFFCRNFILLPTGRKKVEWALISSFLFIVHYLRQGINNLVIQNSSGVSCYIKLTVDVINCFLQGLIVEAEENSDII